MREVSKLIIEVYHHVVVPLSHNLSIHLSGLPGLRIILVLHGPLSTAHPLKHENCEQGHHKVEQVVEQDRQKVKVEVVTRFYLPIPYSLLIFLTIS